MSHEHHELVKAGEYTLDGAAFSTIVAATVITIENIMPIIAAFWLLLRIIIAIFDLKERIWPRGKKNKDGD